MRGSNFGALVLVPFALVLGFAIGVFVVSNHVPSEFVSSAATWLLAAFTALAIAEFMVSAIQSTFVGNDDAPSHTEWPGHLVHYVITDGPVVEQLKTLRGYTFDVSNPRANAQSHNLLVRIGLRRKLVSIPPREPVPGLEELVNGPPHGHE